MTIANFEKAEKTDGMKVAIGGLVVDFQKRDTRRGGKMGIMKLEDYTGTYEVKFFDDDYYKYVNFGEPGTPVFVEMTFSESRYRPGEIRSSINSIDLLSKLKGRLLKGITIELDTGSISNTMIDLLVDKANKPGDNLGSLTFELYDGSLNRTIKLDSALRIPLTRDLAEMLDDMNLSYRFENN